MEGNYGAFGCLCDPENGTIAFVQRSDFLDGKKAAMLARVAEDEQTDISEYDWDSARLFFSDLVLKHINLLL